MIYLDYAATTPLHEEVLEGYYKVLKQYYGNSDSLHEIGRKADRLMKQSRMQVASSLCVKETEIFLLRVPVNRIIWRSKAMRLPMRIKENI